MEEYQKYIRLLIDKEILRIKQDRLVDRITNGDNVLDELFKITDEYQIILIKLLDNTFYKDEEELSIDERVEKYESIINYTNNMLENKEINDTIGNIIINKYNNLYGYLVNNKSSVRLKREFKKTEEDDLIDV